MNSSQRNMKMNNKLSLLNNNSGQGLTEYLILVILVAIGSIVAVREMGSKVEDRVKAVSKQIQQLHVK
jgi:hypothetical protein